MRIFAPIDYIDCTFMKTSFTCMQVIGLLSSELSQDDISTIANRRTTKKIADLYFEPNFFIL